MEILLAILIGAAFGFVLDRVGATNPNYIIRMLNLSNLHLMKTILAGIGVASIFLFGGLLLGLVDPGHLSVKTAYLGVFIGGLLLGLGFAVAGYCPGTGLTALATGRVDALFFVIGGLVGAGAYMLTYAGIAETGLFGEHRRRQGHARTRERRRLPLAVERRGRRMAWHWYWRGLRADRLGVAGPDRDREQARCAGGIG